VENVLAPKSAAKVINDLSSKTKFFYISMDASNMINGKLFPVCVQYFCVDGIHK
jgi:hypothetical protein